MKNVYTKIWVGGDNISGWTIHIFLKKVSKKQILLLLGLVFIGISYDI